MPSAELQPAHPRSSFFPLCVQQCLQYLAEVAGSSSNVENRILQANPILEGFGNAKTIRNNNSSRFGKYVEIFFDSKQAICGAQNTNYLLEKVRVVHQSGDERGYHIFYQLCAGASAEQRQLYHLADASSYSYLNQSGNVHIDGVDDASDFREVDEAMDGLDFTAGEKHAIFSIVAWILHVGNLRFKSLGDKKCEVENRACLKQAAALMEVDDDALTKAITNRVMVVRGQAPMDISLSELEAVSARDALSKFVFARLFDWLVVRINKSIGIGEGKKGKSIGILDIFGQREQPTQSKQAPVRRLIITVGGCDLASAHSSCPFFICLFVCDQVLRSLCSTASSSCASTSVSGWGSGSGRAER